MLPAPGAADEQKAGKNLEISVLLFVHMFDMKTPTTADLAA